MKITVLLSAYNAEKYLREAIESILNQTFRDFEFIIINDGSTDETKEIIEECAGKDARIRLINNPMNLGLTKSLNIGLKEARGEYVARMDADDISLPERFSLQYNLIEKNRDIALIGSSCELIDEQGTKIGERHGYTEFDLIKFNLLFEKPAFVHSSFFFRKSIIDELGGYNESLRTSQDFDLLSRIINQYKISNTDILLVRLRKHTSSVNYKQTKTEIVLRDNAQIYFNNAKKYLPSLEYAQFLEYHQARFGGKITARKQLMTAWKILRQLAKNFIKTEKPVNKKIITKKINGLKWKLIKKYAHNFI